jgi:hypothetical protein
MRTIKAIHPYTRNEPGHEYIVQNGEPSRIKIFPSQTKLILITPVQHAGQDGRMKTIRTTNIQAG